jgi:23S rRNA pseudouridine2605 synthase
MEERVQKLLAQAGFGSRRACEEFIVQGRVRVNGLKAELGQKADPAKDEIMLDGEPLARPEKWSYILLYKPRGVVSSLEPQGDRKTVRDLVPAEERLYPVGRLDMDSEGLILLTNDGELTNKLTHPRYETEKEYRVLVADEPDEKQLNIWRRGVMLEGKRTAPAQVERESHTAEGFWLKVMMHEGRKHEIRDIAKTLGLWVHRLIRVRLGALRIGTLRPGEWRALEPKEIHELKAGPPKSKSRAAPKSGPRRAAPEPPPASKPPASRAPRRRPAPQALPAKHEGPRPASRTHGPRPKGTSHPGDARTWRRNK